MIPRYTHPPDLRPARSSFAATLIQMSPALPDIQGHKWLVAVAAPKEWSAIAPALSGRDDEPLPGEWALINLSTRLDAVLTGVGKANAAGAVARVLDPARHAGVICLGIAGALPGIDLDLADAVIATESVMADEGVRTLADFASITALGFPPTPQGQSIPGSPDLIHALAHLASAQGPIATVSTCSGADALAFELRARTGAVAEAMEGAAVGVSARRVLGPEALFIEVRVISNTTGDRASQVWDLPGALAGLTRLARAL